MKVGITGHQNIDKAHISWVDTEITNIIKKIKIEEAYSCLAKGADQLFANIILSNKIPLIAIIPCKEYEETFNEHDLINYKNILKKAASIIQLDFENPTEESFYEAGKKIVEISDILIAIWNNMPSKGLGGTADIVAIAIDLKKRIIHINPISQTINFINYG